MNHEVDGRTRRRLLAAGTSGALLLAANALGASPPRSWRLLINEAFTGESNLFILTARYQPFAEYVTGTVRSRPGIAIEPVVDVRRFMTLAKAGSKPQLVFGKSVNQLAKLVRDDGYQPLVRRADPYKAAFIVARDSPIRALKDVAPARAKIIMPDELAATTAVARAELRRQNAGDVQIVHTRYQEAVAQQISNGFAQVGVVNPTIARKWTEDGGRVVAETQPVVNWSVLASPDVAEAEVAQLRAGLLAMNGGAPAVLASLGIKQWAAAERADYLALLDYTKE
ncbi:phosphate/phosphite/phosphonate ABC transporter substrate-binding protein [Ramlibacter sp. XY19]|uniref:phosphate/phosphite/phosphonate ABC transporter substrate-binding protein n=1 Tax=Ramlibacter paludis TaxID=2908000 RepID=UPI0023DBC89B|nr:PhnD/SsuA/transferrin family substrate-binding protein [Ramlibacter paludis]MCG2593653.1 phosphate/phosphite/phosphonate ABC transporter substrate-binding protein [Ramlibacter paludis]